jgi:diguanylate cyclase (GGDEF)-like protein
MKQLSSLIGLNLFVCALYAVANITSYALVFPPEEYSVVWLAGGVGVAAVLIFGRRVWPGVILGAVASHSIYYLNFSSLTEALASFSFVFAVVFGSIIQIEVAYRLIDRYVGLDNPLIELRDILLYFFLAGPVGCLAGALLGILLSTFIGAIPFERVLEYLWIWWQCNSLAVLIILPLMMVLFRKPRNNWQIKFFAIGVPLLLCFGILLYNLFGAVDFESKKLEKNMRNDVAKMHRQIELGFKLKEQVIWTTERLLSVTDIQDEDFDEAATVVLKRFGGVGGVLGIFDRVEHEDRFFYEKNILKTSIKNLNTDSNQFSIATNSDFYFAGIKIMNTVTSNGPFDGLDLLSVERAVAVVQDVMSTGVAQSSRIRLLDAAATEGNVLISPLFYNPSAPNYQAVGGDIKGMIVVTYSMEILVANVLSMFPSATLDIEILEDNEVRFSNFGPRPFGYTEPDWIVVREIETLGKKWLVKYAPNANFRAANADSGLWWVSVISAFFIAFIGITLYLVTGQAIGRELIVDSRTAQLRQEVSRRNSTNKQQMLRNDVLESIAESNNLDIIYDQIVALMEQYQDGMSVGIYILSADRSSLTLSSGMNLQADIRSHLSHVSIGYGNTGLGHCAYTSESVFTDDIDSHPYWISKAEVLSGAGFNSCWAIPIISSEKCLLGVFGVYLSERLLPLEHDIEWINQVASLVSIAIEKHGAEQEVEHLAYYDSLTELPNRRLLMARLGKETRRAVENHCYGAALFIDLDHFKTLNDALGHHYGDKLLGQLSTRLKRIVGENILARWGGDEFVLLVPAYYKSFDAVASATMDIAEKVRAIFEQPFDLDGYSHTITCSIGVAPFHENNADSDDILKQADAAMYHAKARGRNHVSMHEEKMQTIADSRLTIEKGLRDALANGGFELAYQPQFKQDKTLIGAEVLIRWPKVIDSDVTTEQFISIAEDSHLIVDIGVWVINKVCEQLALWPALPAIAINISPKQFHREDFIEILEASLAKNELSGDRIVIEITERTMLDDIENTVERMRQLRDMNVRISIDDFGTGYSSLAYISRLPIDQLKIDQSFINTIGKEQSTIVDAIFSIAKSLNLEVVAEGVETQIQFEYLRQQQCDAYQGYLFAYPMGKDDFDNLLTSYKL